MIAKLTGKIDEIKPTELILDVNGVGYHPQIPLTTYENLIKIKEASIYMHTFHKEDRFRLYGFTTESEKRAEKSFKIDQFENTGLWLSVQGSNDKKKLRHRSQPLSRTGHILNKFQI